VIAAAPRFSFDPVEFAGKRVLVTGRRGHGEAIVRRLAGKRREGCNDRAFTPAGGPDGGLFRSGRHQHAPRRGQGGRAGAAELRRPRTFSSNSVGGSSAPGGGVLALTDEDWQKEINLNLFAAVRLDRAFIPGMLEQRSGVIVHISSIQRRLPLFEANACLRGRQSRPHDVQQGAVEGARTQRHPGQHVAPGFIETRGGAFAS